MFNKGTVYTKNDIYSILNVPIKERRGAWDTGYRTYKNNVYIFSNIGIPGRTGHDYNNYWDGDLLIWEARKNSNINQPTIQKLINQEDSTKINLFTRTNDREPFVFEGEVKAAEYKNTTPVKIIWKLIDADILEIEEILTFYEGGIKKVLVNKYERNPLARRICIKHYGPICNVCGFDFNKVYGEIGKGYIQVHHIKPISEVNNKYKLDPIKDLIPICPNCHVMLHRKRKTISAESLKNAMNKLQ